MEAENNMLTLAGTESLVTIPAADLDALVTHFGDRVRRMGAWNVCGDGSLTIPIRVIQEAAAELGSDRVAQAARQLNSDVLAQMFEGSSAASLIDKLIEHYERYFRELMNRYQDTQDTVEKRELSDALVREIFGE